MDLQYSGLFPQMSGFNSLGFQLVLKGESYPLYCSIEIIVLLNSNYPQSLYCSIAMIVLLDSKGLFSTSKDCLVLSNDVLKKHFFKAQASCRGIATSTSRGSARHSGTRGLVFAMWPSEVATH
jgi:hypothetical protein